MFLEEIPVELVDAVAAAGLLGSGNRAVESVFEEQLVKREAADVVVDNRAVESEPEDMGWRPDSDIEPVVVVD